VDEEFIRGAEELCWEDVTVGDEIPTIVRGPLTISDNVSFAIAWGGSFLRAHGLARDYRRTHPAAEIMNAYGISDFPECLHWDAAYAQHIGLAAPYDYGAQRFAWMGNTVTNWMGDAGFLRRLKVELRRFNLVGDTTWCGGRVIAKRVEDECGVVASAYAVDLELSGVDQRGQQTTTGTATVLLPSRSARPAD
jgi:acyl dehydratase